MEVFVLMGGIGVQLGVYASEEEARNAQSVYIRDGGRFLDSYYIVRQVVGATADADADRIWI
jgi:hypothetical protein